MGRKTTFTRQNVGGWQRLQSLTEAQTSQILANIFVISLPAPLVGKEASDIPHSLWDILNNSNNLHHPVAICSLSQRNRFLSGEGVDAIQYPIWSKRGRMVLGLLGDRVLVITWKLWPGGFERRQEPKDGGNMTITEHEYTLDRLEVCVFQPSECITIFTSVYGGGGGGGSLSWQKPSRNHLLFSDL